MRYRRERRKKTMKIVQEIKDKYQTKEKSLTLSGQLLNHYLSGDVNPTLKNKVAEILKDPLIIKKYSSPLAYFKKYNPNDTPHTEDRYKKFFGVYEQTANSQEYLKQIGEQLDIDQRYVFELIEFAIANDPTSTLVKLCKKPYNEQQANSLIREIIGFYHEEQTDIYKVISCAISLRAYHGHPLQPVLADFLENKLKPDELLRNLWEDYKKLGDMKPTKAYKSNPGFFYTVKHKQQFWILLSLFKGISTNYFDISPDMYLQIFEFLKDQDFIGSFQKDIQGLAQGVIVDQGLESICRNNLVMAIMVLISALHLSDLCNTRDAALNPNGRAYKILTQKGEAILTHLNKLSPDLQQEIGVYITAIVAGLNALSLLLQEANKDPGMFTKVKQTILQAANLNSDDYQHSITNILQNEVYQNYLISSEKHLVKNCLKMVMVLIFIGIKDTDSMLYCEGIDEVTCSFLTKLVASITNEHEDLIEFWQNFDAYDNTKVDLSLVFSNLIKIFPFRAHMTLQMAQDLIGGPSSGFAKNIMRVFATLRSFYLDISLRELCATHSSLRPVNMGRPQLYDGRPDHLEEYEFDRPTSIPQLGANVPAASRVDEREDGRCRIWTRTNYWNIFWKSVTKIINGKHDENQNGVSQVDQETLMLICRIILEDPLNAAVIQRLCLTDSEDVELLESDRTYETDGPACSALILMLIEVLHLLVENPDCINLVLNITRALNTLISGSTCKQVFTVIHLLNSQSDEQIEPESRPDVFQSIIGLLSVKQYEADEVATQLLNEVAIMIELFLLKSEYVFDYFPEQQIIAIKNDLEANRVKSMVDQIKGLITAAKSNPGTYWNEETSKRLGDNIWDLSQSFNPGSVHIGSKFMDDFVFRSLKEVIVIVQHKNTINLYNFIEMEFFVRARIFSIINNLLSRFKSQRGKKLSTELNETSRDSMSLEFISNHLKGINIQELIFAPFLTEIHYPAFVGAERASKECNELGIDNSEYVRKVPYSKDQQKSRVAFQTFLIEAFSCFNTLCGLVGEYLLDNSQATDMLDAVRNCPPHLTSPDSFYGREFNDFREEYYISFVLAFLMLSKFNQEKELKFTDEMKLHNNDITIALYLEQSLFVTDAMTDPRYAFAEKIHQNLIHTSGRLGNVARCSSVSTSALSSLVELMKLWRRNKSINKPVLCDILTVGKISAHVSNEILNWTHQMFLDGLSFQAITTSPQLSYKILQFLGETLVSQQGYFNEFMKYCDNVKQRAPSINEFIFLLQRMIKDFRDKPNSDLFERGDNFDCMCYLIQLVSNMYMRPNVKQQHQTQIKNSLIKELSELIVKVIRERTKFIGSFLHTMMSNMFSPDSALIMYESPDTGASIELLRYRYVLQQECRFNFSVSLFMKVLNGELLDHRNLAKVSQPDLANNNPSINPRIYLTLANYLLDSRLVRICNTVSLLDTSIKQVLLSSDSSLDMPSYSTFDQDFPQQRLHFTQAEEWKVDSYKEAFFDENWGNTYDEYQVTVVVRESKTTLRYANSILRYITQYNHLRKLQLYNQMLIQDVNNNLSIVSGNGLNGLMFSTTLHPNPSYNPGMVISNLTKMMRMDELRPEYSSSTKELITAAQMMKESDIGPTERKLFNPLYEYRHQEWLGNLYGISDQNYTEVSAFCKLCDKITSEIRQLAHLMSDAQKEADSDSQDEALTPLLNMVCGVAYNHLTSLAHLVVNSYFHVSESLQEADERTEMQSLIPNTIRTLAKFINTINHRAVAQMTLENPNSTNTDLIDNANYYALFILSQFEKDVTAHCTALEFRNLTNALSQRIRAEGPEQNLMIQSYLLLVKIQPATFNPADSDVLAGLLSKQDTQEDTYKMICMFLIEAFTNPALKKDLSSMRLLTLLCTNKKFLSQPIFENFIYYNGEVLSGEVSLWMWTLATIIQCYEASKRTLVGSLEALVGFVKLYQSRIMSIIGFQFVSLNGQAQNLAGFQNERVRNECFRSTAYLQELELVLALLSLIFADVAKWQRNNQPLFDNITYLLLTRTITLFETRQSISEQYIPISWIEKLNQKVKILNPADEKAVPGVDHAPSRKASIFPKATNKKSSYLSDFQGTRTRLDGTDGSGNYNPDLFSFGIEVRLIKSLVYFLSTVTEALPLVDFVGGGAPGLYNVRDDSGYFPGITTRTGNSIQFKYDQNFWSRIPEYVISLQRYSNAAFERVFCNQEAYTRGLVHLCLTNASSETGFQTQLTNCIFPIVTRAELERLSNTALEMSVFMLYILKSQLPSLDRSISYNTMELMARSVQESMKLMTEHESVNRNHTRPTRGNASVLTRLNQPSVRRDDEERDASSFLQFMKQVLPAAR